MCPVHRTGLLAACVVAVIAVAVQCSADDPAALVQTARKAYASQGELKLVSARLNRETLGQYEKLELDVDLRGTFDNPFDPEQVSLTTSFTRAGGDTTRVAGYYCIPYTPLTPGTVLTGDAPYQRTDTPGWKVQFTPRQPGRYACTLEARDRTGKRVSLGPLRFTVTPRKAHGGVRVARGNPRYFEYDDGSLFYPSGANVAWTHEFFRGKPNATYEHYLPEIAQAGGNATRVWLCHWSWLEWTPPKLEGAGTFSDYAGAGFYNQKVAAGFDRIFALAEQLGLQVVLCTDDNNEQFTDSDSFDSWLWNPYNTRNAGPCGSVAEFWTSPAARRLYRQRLSYINARWGYSPSFWCWNFWNDCDQADADQARWLEEMYHHARGLATNFPDRPVGTNFGFAGADFQNRAMDYVNGGGGKVYFDRVRAYGDYWRRKPFVIFECAFDANDPQWFLPSVHESFWQAAGNGLAGAMCWAWELFEQHGWSEFRPVREFMEALPVHRAPVRPMAAKLTGVRLDHPGTPFVVPVALRPIHRWGVKDPRDTFHISPAGCPEEADLYAALYGKGTARLPWRTTPRFEVDSPDGGTLVVEVPEIGGGDQILLVTVDGAAALRKDLTGGRRELTRAEERLARVPIPAGPHTVVLSNEGGDWILVGSYVFLFQVKDPDASPPVRVLGQQGADFAFAWLQSIYADQVTQWTGVERRQVEGATLQLRDLKPGAYRATWWDTHAGKALSERVVTATDGRLALPLPGALDDDLAVRVLPAASGVR